MKLQTVNDVFFSAVERNRDRVMMARASQGWRNISSAELRDKVFAVASVLARWGIGKGDRVVILAENRPEWAFADFASLLLGAVVVPIYPTLTGEQSLYLFQHSQARVAFVSTRKQYDKVASLKHETQLERIVVMDEITGVPDAVPMPDLLKHGLPANADAIAARGRSIQPDDLATLIYTSGTTGIPKGAMLTHGNIASNLCCSLNDFDVTNNEIVVSFLPLSHVTARHVDYLWFFHGLTPAYCPNFEDLPRILQEVRPTVFVGVPRIYEKIRNAVEQKASGGLKHKLYSWSIRVGQRYRDTVLSGGTPNSTKWKIANRLVFSKIRNGMGGRARIFVSGGAPLGRELASWYANIGIRIHEGYGLTETSPVIAVNTPKFHRLGSVGRPLKNIEIRLAADGELLVRGPSVFKGYWKMPEETAAAFEGDWFKTGDIGAIDADGFLSITDRKKDLIKTSGGKFIAPQPIESSLKANLYVAEAALLGDKRKFPAVLIIPDFAALETWATREGLVFGNREELVHLPAVVALYQSIIDAVNTNLAKYERLKRVLIAPAEPSIADGTLTPSMKLRRRKLEERYKREIDELYADAEIAAEVRAVNS